MSIRFWRSFFAIEEVLGLGSSGKGVSIVFREVPPDGEPERSGGNVLRTFNMTNGRFWTIIKAGTGGIRLIYLVEDDANIRELVCYTLHHSGLEAVGFERPSQFWKAMEQQLPELVMLDIMLPEEDGLTILRRLRGAPPTASIPILLVSAKNSEYDKVLGLDNGADDYLAKPFGMMELVARAKALLRRTTKQTVGEEFRLGTLYVSLSRHLVLVEGEEVGLTNKEFSLLSCLLRNQGRVLTRDQLLNDIWGYSFDGENRTVDVHIRTLRHKLGDAGGFIKTVRGVGYKIGGESGERETI